MVQKNWRDGEECKIQGQNILSVDYTVLSTFKVSVHLAFLAGIQIFRTRAWSKYILWYFGDTKAAES